MTNEELKALSNLDFEKLTLADIKKIDNPHIRTALMSAIAQHIKPKSPVHTSHGSHTSHLQDLPT